MLIKYIAKYRHIITAIIAIIFLGLMIFFGVKTSQIRNFSLQSNLYTSAAMGTVVKKTIYSEAVSQNEEANAMINERLKEFENEISVRVEESEVSECNKNYIVDVSYPLSDYLIDYLRREIEINKESGGSFSPCIRPIADLWGIEDGKTEIPSKTKIQDVLEKSNSKNIEIVDDRVVFHSSDMKIDFGAIGKGAACDEIIKILTDTQVQGAIISIGGSILVYGDKGSGKDWHIGIQDPRAEEGEVVGVVDISGMQIISTSGDYEKYFKEDGKRYHHIFDPATGYPADSGLMSVTVISNDGFMSDALSTACFVMGLQDGMAYVQEKGLEAVFITTDKKIYVTPGIKKKFHLKADGYEVKK